MSSEAQKWAWAADVRPAGAKLVLLRLADYADESGSCFPGQDTLAALCAQSRSTVGRHLAKLEEEGWIRRVRRYRENGGAKYRTSDRYVLNLGAEELPYVAKPHVSNSDISGDCADSYVAKTANLGSKNEDLMSQKHSNLGSNLRQESLREPKELTFSEPKDSPRARAAGVSAEAEALFEAFWAVYPRKVSRGAALPAFIKALRRADAGVILAGVRRYAADPNLPEPRFIPHASTWLNGDRWADGPEPAPAPTVDRQAEILQAEMLRARAVDSAGGSDVWGLPRDPAGDVEVWELPALPEGVPADAES